MSSAPDRVLVPDCMRMPDADGKDGGLARRHSGRQQADCPKTNNGLETRMLLAASTACMTRRTDANLPF